MTDKVTPVGRNMYTVDERDIGTFTPLSKIKRGTDLYAIPVVAGSYTWDDYQHICDDSTVDDTIRCLLEDPTNDNAVCMVRAVIEAMARIPASEGVQE